MFQAMRTVDTVELPRRQIVQDMSRIAMLPVERLGMRHHGVVPASDIQDAARKTSLYEGGAADGVGFAGFGDQLLLA